jgi:threonine dehydrogenase-like Zn-dependent dehydrogenase
MTERRSTARIKVARALWYVKPGVAELRQAPLPPPSPGEVTVEATYSAISRGTERLVFTGAVAESEWERMRAPMQEGAFPFPVKYGYCAVGKVVAGPKALLGETVFALHPHQDVFNVAADRVVAVPKGVPAKRATLAANLETALNAIWDSGASAGDRIVIVGAGIVGLCVAAVATRLPGADVSVIDVAAQRRPIVEALGAKFATALERDDADVVVHTSASAAGLDTAIRCAGFEATIVELSWYGDKQVTVGLGGAFHARRLRLISSQVGQVSPSRRSRWTYRRRLEAALRLADFSALDRLVVDEIAFADAPKALARIFAPDATSLAPVLKYAAN